MNFKVKIRDVRPRRGPAYVDTDPQEFSDPCADFFAKNLRMWTDTDPEFYRIFHKHAYVPIIMGPSLLLSVMDELNQNLCLTLRMLAVSPIWAAQRRPHKQYNKTFEIAELHRHV